MNPTRRTLGAVSTQLNIVYLLRQLARDPASAALNRALGIAYYNDGQLLRSIQAYRMAASAEPVDPNVVYNLARILESHELVDAAAEAYKRLAAAAPGEPAAWATARQFASLAGDPALKADWMNSRLERPTDKIASSDHPESCARAAAAWNTAEFDGSIGRDDLKLAASLYEASTTSQPDDLHAYVDAATLYELLEEYGRAADLWERAGEVAPDTAEAARNQQQRLELLAEVAGGSSADPRKLAEISRLYGSGNDFERAAEFARRSLDVDPDQPDVRRMLGFIHQQMGLPESVQPATN